MALVSKKAMALQGQPIVDFAKLPVELVDMIAVNIDQKSRAKAYQVSRLWMSKFAFKRWANEKVNLVLTPHGAIKTASLFTEGKVSLGIKQFLKYVRVFRRDTVTFEWR
jgi:hypothetical protein